MNPIEERLAALLKSGTPEPPRPVSFEAVRERVERQPMLVPDAQATPRRAPWGMSLLAAAAVVTLLLAVSVGLTVFHSDPRLPDGVKPGPGATGEGIDHLAYVVTGNVWLDGQQLTHDGNDNWPRIRPGGDVVVYSHGTQLWLIATTAGAAPRLLVETGIIGRAAWSPDGGRLAYIDATNGTTLQVADYTDGGLHGAHRVAPAASSSVDGSGWVPLLKRTGAVAWSPDGRYIAHSGGDCAATWTSCVSLWDTVNGSDSTVVGFGGGSGTAQGFANIPAFGADSTTLYLTTQHDDPGRGVTEPGPVRVVSCTIAGCGIDHQAQVGQDGDTVATPSQVLGSTSVLVTGGRYGHAWVTQLAPHTRIYLYQGYGQDWTG